MAKIFRHGRPTIGVLVGWQVYWTPTPYSYLNPIFHGIRAAAEKHDCNLLLACGMGSAASAADPARPAWPVPSPETDFVPVGPWNTDGLIVANPLLSDTRSRYVHDVIAADHPVVFIGDGEGQPAIVADNAGGISQAVRHLFAHGHRRFAFISGNPGDMDGDSGERLRAFQAAIRENALEVPDELIARGHHTFPGGQAAMQQLLASGLTFTAVLASNDESALGAMQVLNQAGLQIPQDVAIMGFDDRMEAVAQTPPLTSIHVPLFKSGYQALELLLQHIQNDPQASQLVKIPTRLAIRQSCGCRPGHRVITAASTLPARQLDPAGVRTETARDMTEAVLAETQHFSVDDTQALCERLVDGFVDSLEKDDPAAFRLAVDEVLSQVELAEDDAHIWQSAISVLRHETPSLAGVLQLSPASQIVALDLLDQAREAISERMQWQHGRYVLDHKWISNRVGLLTARLSTALDESQIFEVLANDLPAMGIHHVSISLFERDQDDPVALSDLRAIPDGAGHHLRFPTRDFPPEGLYRPDQAFSLALLPLVSQVGKVGFVAYDSFNIELNGPITQQIAAALNSARLYAEATEGRKLAEEANRLKSRFFSMVSHELRTPLNLIVGLSEILLQKRGQEARQLPPPYRKDIEQIYASAQHLGRLIRDVLDLASSEVGQLRLDNEVLDLTETLEMVVSTGRRLAMEKGLEWHDSMPDARLWVWGDRTRLRQIALNLVSNAVKFTSHGSVSLQLEQFGDKAIVRVCDTGLGIRPAEQNLIFDEFRRSETVTSRGYSGLGLGLAICRRLVGLHGGEIGVISSGEDGAGSTFHFSLPLIEPEAVRTESRPLSLVTQKSVLLLTNQSGTGERLRDHLVRKGFDVNMLQSDLGADGLAALSQDPPGAIVVDVEIAPSQGWSTLRRLKENPVMRAVPLLFYSLADDKGAMLELDYLTKPIKTADLSQALADQKLLSDESGAEKVFLIVYDDLATLEMHVRIVQSQLGAHRVLKARNGREALQQMQEQRPDLVLLDLMMPELDGFGVLEAMRKTEALRDIPVIVLTGQILTESEMARLNRGVATVLGKGLFSIEETLAHIDAALARKRKLGTEAQRLVRQAMAYLHEHYAETISREDLARHLGMSSDYLTFSFRKEVGMTPIAYLNRYRVNQAKALLEQSDKNVTEIAMLVGFLDSSYFSRVFRRQIGVSPDAYRHT